MTGHSGVRGGQSGFTLAEALFTAAIVVALALLVVLVAIPMYSKHVIASRMSEAVSSAGTIRSAARTYLATHGATFPATPMTLTDLGFGPNDLDGRFVTQSDFKFVPTASSSTYTITYTPTAAAVKLGMQKYVIMNPPSGSEYWKDGD